MTANIEATENNYGNSNANQNIIMNENLSKSDNLMATIQTKENVFENCNVNQNIIMNENSSKSENAVVIQVCSNCNYNIEISCCTCSKKIPCNFTERVFKMSIKRNQLLLTYLKINFSQLLLLTLTYLLCCIIDNFVPLDISVSYKFNVSKFSKLIYINCIFVTIFVIAKRKFVIFTLLQRQTKFDCYDFSTAFCHLLLIRLYFLLDDLSGTLNFIFKPLDFLDIFHILFMVYFAKRNFN